MNDYFLYNSSIKIYFEKHGNGPVTLIFIHGFACSHLNWYILKSFFETSQHTLYFIDLKGFGYSDKPHDKKYSIRDQAEIVRSFITEKKLTNCTLIGHSYGGNVALLTSILLSDTFIKKLILIGTQAYIDTLPRFIKILKTPLFNRFALLILYLLPHAISRVLKRIYYNPAKVTNEIIALYKPFYKKPVMQYTYIHTAKCIIPDNYEDIIKQYKNIKIPVLLLWGRHDRVVSKRYGYRLKEAIPSATLEIIKNCGHNTMEECPEESCKLIRNFVKSD